ncbi:hypothetical protein L0668_04100 [Paraglaciecola aquimarina]|uniref:Translation initiation factor beta propellor-like domain-containing protein n=1 Tax=Paraglaciecola algarum TaxID=3050085 RepID=A0ABS9D2X5_9ALTE|nr:hypothetical protein [Paraglaciecola sp. G1-23]MCF2947277.1 hypothetical protein [Paraglaciecola sp. G1-23]
MLLLQLTSCTEPSDKPKASYQQVDEIADAANISADASISVISNIKSGIQVWDLQSNTQKFAWNNQEDAINTVTNIHIAADNSYVVTSSRETFTLWNLLEGEPEGYWRIDEASIRDVAVSSLGRGILVGRSNGKVMFFEPNTTRRLEFLGHQEKVNSVDISPNGFYALTGSNDYVAYLWDTRSGQVIHKFEHSSRVTKVSLDDQGRYAFTADSKRDAKIWDLTTGQEVSNLQYLARQRIFTTASFSPDGKYLLTGSPAKRMNLWDVTTGKELKEWYVSPRENSQPPTAVVYSVAFINNQQILSASSSGLVEKWDVK